MTNRYKALFISNKEMFRLITGEIKITNIPEYTKLCEVQPCYMKRGWEIIIEHPSFDIVPDGLICQSMNAEFEETNKTIRRKLYFE